MTGRSNSCLRWGDSRRGLAAGTAEPRATGIRWCKWRAQTLNERDDIRDPRAAWSETELCQVEGKLWTVLSPNMTSKKQKKLRGKNNKQYSMLKINGDKTLYCFSPNKKECNVYPPWSFTRRFEQYRTSDAHERVVDPRGNLYSTKYVTPGGCTVAPAFQTQTEGSLWHHNPKN